MNYLRQSTNIHKSQTSHHSPHRHHHHNPNRTLIPPIQNSQISPHQSAYLLHNLHHSPVDTSSSQRQQQQQQQSHYSPQQRIPSHHNDLIKNTKETISIQEFINKNVNDFVGSSSMSF